VQGERYELSYKRLAPIVQNRTSYEYYLDCRDVETSAESAPRGSSPHASDNPSLTSAPTGSSPVSTAAGEVTAAASTSVAASTAATTQETEPTDDFFDPRGPTSGLQSCLLLCCVGHLCKVLF